MTVLAQTAVFAGRNLVLMRRNPTSVVSAVVIPVVFFLGFYAVLDRLLEARGIAFAPYVTPVIVVQAMFFAAFGSATYLAQDASGGMLARTRSLPIGRVVPVASRLAADLVRGLLSLGSVLLVATIAGFRFSAGPWAAAGFCLLSLLFLLALSAGCGAIALAAGNPESAVQTLFLPYLPLLMLSTGFVPAEQFPNWLEVFVRYQPVSETVQALRALSAGGATAGPVLVALLWSGGLLLIGGVFAARTFWGRH